VADLCLEFWPSPDERKAWANAMRRLLERFSAPGLLRNAVTLAGATAASQALTLAAILVLTRLYSPVEFSTAATFAAVIAMIVVTGTLQYELAIPLPRRDRSALQIAGVALAALGFVAVCAAGLSPYLNRLIGNALGLPGIVFALLVGLGVITAGFYQVVTFWAIRKNRFGAIAGSRLQQTVVSAVSQIFLGLVGMSALGLVLGQVLGQFVGLGRLTRGADEDRRRSAPSLRIQGLAWAAKRYRRFPLYENWRALLNAAGEHAPLLLFAALFSPVLAGYYALGHRVLTAPVGLIGKAMSQALIPEMTKARRTSTAGPLVLKALEILTWASLLPFAVIALTAQDLTPLIFGAHWQGAGLVVAWTAVWMSWHFIALPLSPVMAVFEAVRLHLAVQVLLFALRIAGIMIGFAVGSQSIALVSFSLLSVAGYVVYIAMIGHVASLSPVRLLRVMAPPLSMACGCAAAVLALGQNSLVVKYLVISAFCMVWAFLFQRRIRAVR
jgi:lipopolysaccharide exporter